MVNRALYFRSNSLLAHTLETLLSCFALQVFIMEVAHTIMQLCAYREMFIGEIAQIDTDLQVLSQLCDRYPPGVVFDPMQVGGSDVKSVNRTSRSASSASVRRPVAAAFGKPAKELRALRADKEKQLNEVQRQIELFQLHHNSGVKLVKKLNKEHGSGSSTGMALPVLDQPYRVNVTSNIIAS